MPGKILTARDTPTGFRFRFHLDETKREPDPDLPPPSDGEEDTRPLVPHRDFVREYVWGKPPRNPGETNPQYNARLKAFEQMAAREAKLLAKEEAARLAAMADVGTALSDEGGSF